MVRRQVAGVILLLCAGAAGCDRDASTGKAAPVQAAQAVIPAAPDALPAEQTGGFDGAKAYEHAARIAALGPRPPGSEGHRKAQEYFRTQLRGYGCAVEEDSFEASTPQGRVRMTNIVGKAAGGSDKIILLSSHYDTVVLSRVANFVGAEDGASGNGVMLELARLLCKRQNAMSIWIVFFDGEEAFVEWSETDGAYGSRQMAAKMANSDDLKRIQAMIVADMVGDKDLQFKREENSTEWLKDLVWDTAKKLGYGEHFADGETDIQDDHIPFVKRKVSAVDIIDLEYPFWHTEQDTIDKVSARSLGITGHVILKTVEAVEKKPR